MSRIEPRESLCLVRIGGVEANAMERFGNGLQPLLRDLEQSESTLRSRREDLIEALHRALAKETPALRRRLLAIKRDLYNGRPISRYQGKAAWSEAWQRLNQLQPELSEQVVHLEAAVAALNERLETACDTARDSELRTLLELLDRPELRCGLAMASPELLENSRRLQNRETTRYGRRERRLLAALLRYASRAALKTSPFSTFTPVGLGRVHDQQDSADGCPGIQLLSGPTTEYDETQGATAVAATWSRHSLVRLRRHVLDRCQALLLRFEPFLQGLEIEINSSLRELDTDRFVLVRPARWQADPESRELRFHEEAVVKLSLKHPAIAQLRQTLASGPQTHARLVQDLEQQCGLDHTEASHLLASMLRVGVLCPLWPWAVHEDHLELRMLSELKQLLAQQTPASSQAEERAGIATAHERLASFVRQLEKLVQLQQGMLDTSEPGRSRQSIEALIDPLIATAVRLAAGEEDLVANDRWARSDVYQDLWIANGARQDGALVSMDGQAARRALRSARPLLRYARLQDCKLDFLLSLGALMAQRWPGQPSVPLVQALDAALPLWRSHVAHQKHSAEAAGTATQLWNPQDLQSVRDLATLRQEAKLVFQNCTHQNEEAQVIDGPALERWLDRQPSRLTEAVAGSCLFLQPASSDGSLWMLNRMKEGTGRFSSRYTAIMPEQARDHYLQAWQQASEVTVDGEVARLLDVQCVQGDTLNVHRPQTAELLLLPGDRSDVATERQLHLGDLELRLSEDGWPSLHDRRGQRYLPVHLGGGYSAYMPMILRLLCAFGPSETAVTLPPPRVRQEGREKGNVDQGNAMWRSDRTLIGNLVLHRRTWSFPTAELSSQLAACAKDNAARGEARRSEAGRVKAKRDAAVLRQVHRWRQRHGIPRRVFATEMTRHAVSGTVAQPQYLDLGSPHFAELFRSLLASASQLSLSECLPEPQLYPQDLGGQRWTVELLLDEQVLVAPLDTEIKTRPHDAMAEPAPLAGASEPTMAPSGTNLPGSINPNPRANLGAPPAAH